MGKSRIEYYVAREFTLDSLVYCVQDKIDDNGYEPIGGISMDNSGYYIQALIRKRPLND